MKTRTTQPIDSRRNCTSNNSRPCAAATRSATARIRSTASIRPPRPPKTQKVGTSPLRSYPVVLELLILLPPRGSGQRTRQQVVVAGPDDLGVDERARRGSALGSQSVRNDQGVDVRRLPGAAGPCRTSSCSADGPSTSSRDLARRSAPSGRPGRCASAAAIRRSRRCRFTAGGHVVVEVAGRGALLVRVGEHADVVEPDGLDEAGQLVDVGLGFARESRR